MYLVELTFEDITVEVIEEILVSSIAPARSKVKNSNTVLLIIPSYYNAYGLQEANVAGEPFTI